MKSHTAYLTFQTKNRRELIRITEEVKRIVEESGIREGLCLVSSMHLTASVIIQDDEEGLHRIYGNGLKGWHPLERTTNTTGREKTTGMLTLRTL